MDARDYRAPFSVALARTFEMKADEAEEVADAVLERFAEAPEVDDETLDADLRSVFYTLEAKRMLSFRRVEYTREDGDKRRAFYWKLRLESLTERREVIVPIETDVYADLPASAWTHAVGS
ncbi:MAG: hypothetical protein WDA16_14645 [Candidatus Thermoplasmatota archaeon]